MAGERYLYRKLGRTMSKKKIIIWIGASVVGFVGIAALVMLILTLANSTEPAASEAPGNSTGKVEPVVPATDEKAEALKTEAQKALSAQDFDGATKKYEEAKSIYEADNNEVYVSDIDMQLDLVAQQKEVYEKLNSSGKNPQLSPTNKQQ